MNDSTPASVDDGGHSDPNIDIGVDRSVIGSII